MTETNLRIGHGFDVHRFSVGFQADRPLILAGCELPVELSLEAHSDGDLVLHALCDAILGAAAMGDIGQHFPDTDAAFAGIDSAQLLQRVLKLTAEAGYSLVNADITVVAQLPRLTPYRPQILERLASLTGLPATRINFKATTTERLGAIGREEGMACHCVVLMQAND